MKKAILYIHGKGGSHEEGDTYKQNCEGFDIVGVAYDAYVPWVVEEQIISVYKQLQSTYDAVYLIANSIGAYFAMHTLQKEDIQQALFISPILDMEALILQMMKWANVSEKELEEKGEIQTYFDEVLSWEYVCYVRQHPIHWNIPTEILYGEHDHLVPKDIVDNFVHTHPANVRIMNDGEHFFHTSEQLEFLSTWMKEVIA